MSPQLLIHINRMLQQFRVYIARWAMRKHWGKDGEGISAEIEKDCHGAGRWWERNKSSVHAIGIEVSKEKEKLAILSSFEITTRSSGSGRTYQIQRDRHTRNKCWFSTLQCSRRTLHQVFLSSFVRRHLRNPVTSSGHPSSTSTPSEAHRYHQSSQQH